MSTAHHEMPMGIPPDIEQLIRGRGAVLDMPFTRSLYLPLLDEQRRDGVVVQRDLAYGPDVRHRVDIYRPQAAQSGGYPVLLVMHGGGFVRGDKSERENIGWYFARQGFLVAIANYRLAPGHVWPAGAEDVVAVHQWLLATAASLNGDGQRIFLLGESAGAAHVAAAVLMRRFHPQCGLSIAGVLLISGVYDVELEHLARRQFELATPDPRNEPYYGREADRYREMSTVRMIDAAPVPMLITYAELDLPQMQVQAGELFAALITRHAFSPDLHVVRGHNHLTQLYSINTGDESLTRIILQFTGKHG